jgi:hypothetical protein
MSGSFIDPSLSAGFVGILFLFLGLQDLILMPPDRRDVVSGVHWIAAGVCVVCLGVAHHYDLPIDLALFLLLLVSGLGAVVKKLIGLAVLWGAKPQPFTDRQKATLGVVLGAVGTVTGCGMMNDLVPPDHVVAACFWLLSGCCVGFMAVSQYYGYRRLSIFFVVASVIAGGVAIVLDVVGRLHWA